jgi:hypothetical protein
MTNFNTQQVDEFAGIDTDELFDNAIMLISEAQSQRHIHDVAFYISEANTILDYLSTQRIVRSK